MDDPCLPPNRHMNSEGFFSRLQDVSTCVNMLLISLRYLIYPWKKSGFNEDLLRDNVERQYSSLFFLCQMCTNTCTYIYPRSVSQYPHMHIWFLFAFLYRYSFQNSVWHVGICSPAFCAEAMEWTVPICSGNLCLIPWVRLGWRLCDADVFFS